MTGFPGPILRQALEVLEIAVDRLTHQVPAPLFVGEPRRGHFRYAHRNSQVMQILKAVRVISGFHAAIHLIHVGHHQDTAVIMRSVDEALQDIDVLDEAHHSEGGTTAYQQQLVEEFFASDDAARVKDILSGTAKPVPRVSRKKKRAAVERRLSAVPSTINIRVALDAIDAVLDGYVHTGYSQVMELYSASPTGERFHMRGVHDPGRQALMAAWIPRFVVHALNSVARLLQDAKLGSNADQLIEVRKRLETSAEHPR